MKTWFGFVRSLFSPLLSIILLVSSSAPFMTFISVRLTNDGVTEFIIGLIHSAFYVGFLIGSAQSEKLIKRIGHIRAFAAFATLYSTTVLLQGIFIHPLIWMLLRFFGGIAISGLYIIIESWFLSRGTPETRGKVLSIYMIAIYGSQSISQLLLQLMHVQTLIPFLITGVLGTLSVIPIATTLIKSPEIIEEVAKKSFLEVIKHTPIGFIGSFMAGMILSSIFSFIPTFADMYHLSVPYIMMITIAGGFILQFPIGYLSDRFDRRRVLTITSFCIIIPCLLIMFLSSYAIFVYALSFLVGGLSFTLYPLSISHVCDRIDAIYITYVTGLLSLVYGVGSILGPLISPIFMESINPAAIFLYISVIGFLLGVIGVYFKTKRPRPTPKYDKVEYVPVAGNAPTPRELDPRTPEENIPQSTPSNDSDPSENIEK